MPWQEKKATIKPRCQGELLTTFLKNLRKMPIMNIGLNFERGNCPLFGICITTAVFLIDGNSPINKLKLKKYKQRHNDFRDTFVDK